MPDSFAEVLRELLERKGINGYRLSQLVGVTRQTISKLLAGASAPTFETAARIAMALDVPLDDLKWDTLILPDAPEAQGRGRPRKDADDAPEPQPKRPRGRPKKSDD